MTSPQLSRLDPNELQSRGVTPFIVTHLRALLLDYDDVDRPRTGNRPVFAIRDAGKPLTKVQLVSMIPNAFADGIGKLDGNYHIRLSPIVDHVQHAPRT